MSDWRWVMIAYGLAWAVLAGYALYLARRVRRAAADADSAGGAP